MDAAPPNRLNLIELLRERTRKALPSIRISKIGQGKNTLKGKAVFLHRAVMAFTAPHADLPRKHWIDRNTLILGKCNIINLIDMTRAIQKVNKAVRHVILFELLTSFLE